MQYWRTYNTPIPIQDKILIVDFIGYANNSFLKPKFMLVEHLIILEQQLNRKQTQWFWKEMGETSLNMQSFRGLHCHNQSLSR